MLSVLDLVDVLGTAESYADQHRYRELVAFLSTEEEAVSQDPTLQYLAAYSAYMTGNETEALKRLKHLVEAGQVDEYDRLYRRIVNLRGIMAVETGNLGEAVSLLDELEGLAWSASDHRYVAYATLNKGIVMELAGRAQDAIAEINRAQYAFQKLGDQRSLAACAHNLAMAHRTLERYQLAESLFELAGDMFSKLKCVEERLTSQIELAHCVALSGDHHRAEAYVNDALAGARAHDNRRLVAEAQRVLGALQRRRGRLKEARALLTAAMETAVAGDIRALRSEVLIELGLLSMQEGDVVTGAEQLREAARVFRAMGSQTRAQEIERLSVTEA